MWKRKLLILCGVLALGGCTLEPTAVVRTLKLGPDEIVTTDARQRVILNSEIGPVSSPGYPDPLRLVCTEPSPDVAIAIANSFSTGISVFGQGSGSLSGTSIQALAQLVERTASIQLLRDKMYQTCLAYSNGAITGTTYSLVMSRLDDTIVSLLLGETAGGAFGRNLAALGTEAEAEARATLIGLPAGLQGIQSASNELAVAQKDVDEKAAILREKQAVVAGKQAPPAEELAAVKKAQDDLDKAKESRDRLLNALRSHADTIAKTSGKASTVSAGGGLKMRPDSSVADTLARMQEEFIRDDFSDFLVHACIIEMGIVRADKPQGVEQDLIELLIRRMADGDARANEALNRVRQLNPLRVPSFLAFFCERNLIEIAGATHARNVELHQKRLERDIQRTAVDAQRATAEAERAKQAAMEARTAAIQEFNKALAACNAITDAELKKSCVSKLPVIGL